MNTIRTAFATAALLLLPWGEVPPPTSGGGIPSLSGATPLAAQQAVGRAPGVATEDGRPVLEAVRLQGPVPSIDGRLDEPVWQTAPVATNFVQMEPEEGAPPSERTEVRILYDDEALYVGAWMFDSSPDSIVAQLTRRDQPSYSDLIWISIDSYHDRRTAFDFAVNPLGVKTDGYRYDDTEEDTGWDAVWEVATRVTDWGWAAEFRIPLSQLRFSSSPEQVWGLNVMREIARKREKVVWAPTSRRTPGVVSRFGELRGLQDLSPPRRLEVMPYTVARGVRAPGDGANPFHRNTAGELEVGGDLRYGITSNLTLNVTLNPDFGQVEADPGQVNLSAFETFLPERRPFFVEGANIFNLRLRQGDGDGANESLFYSRRVGRAPQGRAEAGGGWVDAPDRTRILGAAKLSGKTGGGLSVGFLHAVTGEAEAEVATGTGERFTSSVEPLTNYMVGRLQQDFREGATTVGVIGTATNRETVTAEELSLRSGAYTAGVDARHRWGPGNSYQAGASLIGSHVRGSEGAILATQLSPARYYQRPDNTHVTLDPTRTSLSGWSAMWEVGKTGGFWRVATGGIARSPGFETNDLGFMNEADMVTSFVWGGLRETTPGRVLRSWGVNANGWGGWSHGGERGSLGGNVNGQAQFLNQWSTYAGVNRNASTYSARMLRGGPLFRQEGAWSGWWGVNSDSRKPVQVNWHNNAGARPESDSWNVNTNVNVRWRPSERATLSAGPFFSRNVDDRQWVNRITAGGEPHYLFGRLHQTTSGVTARMDVAFTPNLTFQLYAQPFMAAGAYKDFRIVADPRAERYADRFTPVDARAVEEGTRYVGDLNGDGTEEGWRNPDFNRKQFRSNAVLRWEYRPGSTLFLVWAQSRDHSIQDGRFRLGEGLDDLFGAPARNVLMLKVSYWMNP